MSFFLASLFLLAPATQDEPVKRALDSLRSDDVKERDQASGVLRTLRFDQLAQLEPSLDAEDAEVRTRVREAFMEVLCASLGRPKERFSARAVASREVMEAWVKDGRSPDRIPKGYERLGAPASLQSRNGYEYLTGAEILVEVEPVFTQDHVVESEPLKRSAAVNLTKPWVTTFVLNEEGAKRLDAGADRLYQQRPVGLLALIVDGAIISAPAIQSSTFRGRGEISGSATREEAVKQAALLKGRWFSVAFRVQADADLDAVSKLVHETRGLDAARVDKTGEREFTVRSDLDARQQDLVTLWKELRRKGYTLLPGKK